jgi:hypothetical protein
MRRHLKGMFFSMLAAKLGRMLHRRGHSTAGHGHGHGYGPGQGYGHGQGHYGYHGHYRSKGGHYGYHGHYRPKRKGRRRYW